MDTSNKTNKIFILSATVLMFTASLGVFSFISYQRVAENKNSTITFSGEGTVSSTPNIAEFTFNISAERDELKQAREEVTKKVDDIYDYLLKEKKLDKKDVKTTSYDIRPNYDYISDRGFGGSRRVFRGYEVSHTTSVKIKDIDDTSEIISAVSDKKPSYVSNLTFKIDEEEEKQLQDEAVAIAILNAKKRAKNIASSTNIKLGKIQSIYIERNYNRNPQPFAFSTKAVSAEFSADIQTSVGENDVTASVQITYRLR